MKRGTIIIEPNRIAVVLSSDGTVWMTVEEIASIFHVTGVSVERHIAKLFSECELDKRKVRTEQSTMRNGRRYVAEYYNLDMIIALCFRINTPSSKAFPTMDYRTSCSSYKDKTDNSYCSANPLAYKSSQLILERRRKEIKFFRRLCIMPEIIPVSLPTMESAVRQYRIFAARNNM